MINIADISYLIYKRTWELSRILDEKDFMQRAEELSWIHRAILNHAEKLARQEKGNKNDNDA